MSLAERRTLLGMLALAAIADTLLSPFYPQFFAATFGADQVLTPAIYVALCRLAVALALPLWARAARRFAPLRVVAVAQGAAGLFGLFTAAAPTLGWFLGLSFVTESARTAYLLVYPALVMAEAPARRGRVVVFGAALLHVAGVISALAGGVLLSSFGGRAPLLLAAAIDVVQLAILWPIARRVRPAAAEPEPAPAPAPEAPRRPAAPVSNHTLLQLATVGLLTTFAYVLLRPYFTLYLTERLLPGASLPLLGAIFVLPSVAVLGALPFASRVLLRGGLSLPLAISASLLALSCAAQAAASLPLLLASRLVHGLGMYAVDVCLDYGAMTSGGNAAERFGWVHALQNLAIVVAPLAAGALVHGGYTRLFAVAAGVALLAAVAALRIQTPAPISALTEGS